RVQEDFEAVTRDPSSAGTSVSRRPDGASALAARFRLTPSLSWMNKSGDEAQAIRGIGNEALGLSAAARGEDCEPGHSENRQHPRVERASPLPKVSGQGQRSHGWIATVNIE